MYVAYKHTYVYKLHTIVCIIYIHIDYVLNVYVGIISYTHT